MNDNPTADLPGPPTAFADPAAIWLSPAMLFHTTKFGRLQNMMPPWQNQLGDGGNLGRTVAMPGACSMPASDANAGQALYAELCQLSR